MNGKHLSFAALSLLSACLLSAGFLFPHCGGFALIGFIPLLWMDRIATREGTRHFWWWHYLTFVLWNAFTTFWVCNATVAGGIAAILANAFQMSLIWAIFRFSRKSFGGVLPYIFLAATWIAWERFYFDAEISWPWLTLGNAFAMSHTCIQWYEITGTLGGSLWIWVCNLAAFGLMTAFQDGKWNLWNSKARSAAVSATILVFTVPLAVSWIRYATYEEDASSGTLDVCLLQPNLDPYQKFQYMSQSEQNDIIAELMEDGTEAHGNGNPLLIMAPEAITNDVLLDHTDESPTVRTFKSTLAGTPDAGLLFGASTYEFFAQEKAPSYTARRTSNGLWYENHNSAMLLDSTSNCGIYHKSRLVIGTEKMPWPKLFSRIENALGGNLMGHCIGQKRPSLLDFKGNLMGCAVCYESIYPEYVASYVRLGARMIAVITNDAWWGDTPGYRQHLHYSCLRAIETRRDVARSANTGISAFINQRGDIVSSTSWWERGILEGKVKMSCTTTPFVIHGDVIGRLCSLVFFLLACAAVVRRLVRVSSRRP